MSEFMLITQDGQPAWPAASSTSDPETIMLRMAACLRDLDRIDARLAAAYLETAILHLRAQFGPAASPDDSSGTE